MHVLPLSRVIALCLLAAVTSLPIEPLAAGPRGGVVYFSRPASFNGAFTRPDVIVDGAKVGTIGSGECHRLRLPAGRHEIIVRDQTSLLSRFGLEIHAKRVNVADGAEVFVDIQPLQDAANFNDRAPAYQLLVSDSGRSC